MSISVFDLFSIGIGPSSSHTVGPMRAAKAFITELQQQNSLAKVIRLQTELYGSLALTGLGHGTDKAVINGLEGKDPESVDPDSLIPRMQTIIQEKKLHLDERVCITFNYQTDLLFHRDTFLPKHSNGLRFTAFDEKAHILLSKEYYSIGGGFITTAENYGINPPLGDEPYPFDSAEKLLAHTEQQKLDIYQIILANEKTKRTEQAIYDRIRQISNTMIACIEKGCRTPGILPGGLGVKRRAPELYEKLITQQGIRSINEDADIMNRLNLYAMAVNEENAAGGRIVTAPTNGAAGIIPAVMQFYLTSHENANETGLFKYFLTAGAIGILCKKNASISGAEVGCQGEVGSACAMAAAGLTAALGGNNHQVENAAEIAMEHHLGMTCDPIAGLVQIPCIERNAMGAVKAVNAARMALLGNGQHYVSFDKALKTMKQTGRDMLTIYKETSLGGLAVNVPEC